MTTHLVCLHTFRDGGGSTAAVHSVANAPGTQARGLPFGFPEFQHPGDLRAVDRAVASTAMLLGCSAAAYHMHNSVCELANPCPGVPSNVVTQPANLITR